jgi:hypothetical protein
VAESRHCRRRTAKNVALGWHLTARLDMDPQSLRFLTSMHGDCMWRGVVVVFDDDTGPPDFRPIPVGRRKPDVDIEVTEAMWEAITRVVEANPRWGPKQVHAELRRTRHDIPIDAVVATMDRSVQ